MCEAAEGDSLRCLMSGRILVGLRRNDGLGRGGRGRTEEAVEVSCVRGDFQNEGERSRRHYVSLESCWYLAGWRRREWGINSPRRGEDR